jgi:transposase
MNTKLHAVSDADGQPLSFFMTAGQVSDYTGAASLLDDLPKAEWLLGDRGYDADWFRDALGVQGIQPCISDRKSHNEPVRYDSGRGAPVTYLSHTASFHSDERIAPNRGIKHLAAARSTLVLSERRRTKYSGRIVKTTIDNNYHKH